MTEEPKPLPTQRALRDRIEAELLAQRWSWRMNMGIAGTTNANAATELAGLLRKVFVMELADAHRYGDDTARIRASLLAVCGNADARQEFAVSTGTIRAILAGDQ